jgi:hypothetical protein
MTMAMAMATRSPVSARHAQSGRAKAPKLGL